MQNGAARCHSLADDAASLRVAHQHPREDALRLPRRCGDWLLPLDNSPMHLKEAQLQMCKWAMSRVDLAVTAQSPGPLRSTLLVGRLQAPLATQMQPCRLPCWSCVKPMDQALRQTHGCTMLLSCCAPWGWLRRTSAAILSCEGSSGEEMTTTRSSAPGTASMIRIRHPVASLICS